MSYEFTEVFDLATKAGVTISVSAGPNGTTIRLSKETSANLHNDCEGLNIYITRKTPAAAFREVWMAWDLAAAYVLKDRVKEEVQEPPPPQTSFGKVIDDEIPF